MRKNNRQRKRDKQRRKAKAGAQNKQVGSPSMSKALRADMLLAAADPRLKFWSVAGGPATAPRGPAVETRLPEASLPAWRAVKECEKQVWKILCDWYGREEICFFAVNTTGKVPAPGEVAKKQLGELVQGTFELTRDIEKTMAEWHSLWQAFVHTVWASPPDQGKEDAQALYNDLVTRGAITPPEPVPDTHPLIYPADTRSHHVRVELARWDLARVSAETLLANDHAAAAYWMAHKALDAVFALQEALEAWQAGWTAEILTFEF